jgi:hypothetical protein
VLSGAGTYRLPSGELLQDPTRPANQPQAATAAVELVRFELNYILKAEQRRQAIINGRQVAEGERIGTALVQRIDSNSVTLLVDGQPRVLTVSARPSIKQ